MGMTFCNLHLWGIDRQTIIEAMGEGDTLREINAPWLSLLPPNGDVDEAAGRLFRLAKVLTKDRPDALALHFYYFDDDSFHIRVCRDGRCAKTLSDEQSWAFLAKTLATLYADGHLDKAFKHKNLCVELDEKLQLLEETAGVALYDGPWAESRRVYRSTATRDRLDARATRLRALKNRFELIPLPVGEWPDYPRACLELASRLPKAFESNYHSVLGDPFWRRFAVPRQPWRVAMIGWDDARNRRLTLYDAREKRLHQLTTSEQIERALWVDRKARPVLIAFGQDGLGIKRAVCLKASGETAWAFEPPLQPFESLDCVDVNGEGVLTLTARAEATGQLHVWQVDGEGGRVVADRFLPYGALVDVDALDGFVAVDEASGELVLLNRQFGKRAGWPLPIPHFNPETCIACGTCLWMPWMIDGKCQGFDLACGELRTMRPELPVCLEASIDANTLAAYSSGKSLLLMDTGGRLVSRHTLENWRIERSQEGIARVVEIVGWPNSAMFTAGVLDRLEIRVWAIRER